jgi:hypothetical protein
MEIGQRMDDWTPERVVDRLQIEEVLYKLCRAVDRRTFDLLDEVYHPDATINKYGDDESWLTWKAEAVERHRTLPVAIHMMTGLLIDFINQDRAFVESSCIALEQRDGDGTESGFNQLVLLRYADLFERRDGLWRIGSRTFVPDQMMRVAMTPAGVDRVVGRNAGRRDENDPIVQMRKQLNRAHNQ